MPIVKYIKRQDSGWKQSSGCSGETSINLSNEIFGFLTYGMVDCGEECGITLKIFKDDFLCALDFIKSQLPLYRTTSRTSEIIYNDAPIIERMKRVVENFFQEEPCVNYTVALYRRKDGRIYLKGLKQNSFSIRDYLVEMGSALIFSNSIDGFTLRIESGVSEGELDYKLNNTELL